MDFTLRKELRVLAHFPSLCAESGGAAARTSPQPRPGQAHTPTPPWGRNPSYQPLGPRVHSLAPTAKSNYLRVPLRKDTLTALLSGQINPWPDRPPDPLLPPLHTGCLKSQIALLWQICCTFISQPLQTASCCSPNTQCSPRNGSRGLGP